MFYVSHVQPDPNEEMTALRVLIMRAIMPLSATTFLQSRSGPDPRPIKQAQATLYASLAASLFSTFLAMLGKQ